MARAQSCSACRSAGLLCCLPTDGDMISTSCASCRLPCDVLKPFRTDTPTTLRTRLDKWTQTLEKHQRLGEHQLQDARASNRLALKEFLGADYDHLAMIAEASRHRLQLIGKESEVQCRLDNFAEGEKTILNEIQECGVQGYRSEIDLIRDLHVKVRTESQETPLRAHLSSTPARSPPSTVR